MSWHDAALEGHVALHDLPTMAVEEVVEADPRRAERRGEPKGPKGPHMAMACHGRWNPLDHVNCLV